MIRIAPGIEIDKRSIEERFVRAPGPGGQNVNKLATAVQLRFNLAAAKALPEEVRERLGRLAGRRLTAGGVLIIEAHRFRTQERNRRDALERLVALIRRAAERPRPRRKTKPSAAKKRRRLTEKRRRG